MGKIKNISKIICDNAMLIVACTSFILFCIAGIVKEDMDSAILFQIIMWGSLTGHALWRIERKIDKGFEFNFPKTTNFYNLLEEYGEVNVTYTKSK